MGNEEITQEKIKSSKWAFVVCHVSGLYVGEKADEDSHWKMYALAENAYHFASRKKAEAFISLRPYWLQKALTVERIQCTQNVHNSTNESES